MIASKHPVRRRLRYRSQGQRGGAWLLLLLVLFGAPAAARADSDQTGMLDEAAAFTREYLADKRRAGALVGSLLGAALTVHPAGSVVGSLLGFWVGKATMHEDPQALVVAQREVNGIDPQRPIVAAAGNRLATLSFGDPAPASTATPEVAMPTLAMLPGAAPASPLSPLGGHLPVPPDRQQLAALCAGGGAAAYDPRLHKACFYMQGH